MNIFNTKLSPYDKNSREIGGSAALNHSNITENAMSSHSDKLNNKTFHIV